jgi:hypothetical protein
MVKIKDIPSLKHTMESKLKDLQATIEEMDEKRGSLFIRWLDQQNRYLQRELEFNPSKLKRYKRGEVVYIHLGFNTGSEHGGPHWAVVLDDNRMSSPTAVVLPLGSLEKGKTSSDIHRDDVYIGVIPTINDNKVFGIPTQIRAVSKMRIIKPKSARENAYMLTHNQLDAIDFKILEMLFKNSKKIYPYIASIIEAAPASENK